MMPRADEAGRNLFICSHVGLLLKNCCFRNGDGQPDEIIIGAQVFYPEAQ